MDNIETLDQSNSISGNLVLCTCTQCVKNKHTNSSGKQISGLWIHPANERKHRRKMFTESESTPILEALAQDLNSKAKIEEAEPEPEEDSSDSGSNHIKGPDDPNVFKLAYFIMYFISWLFLECRMSRNNCRQARDYVVRIIRLCTQINLDNNWERSVPKDVRTMTKHLNLEANLERYVCCIKCYSLYEPEVAPTECGYRELPSIDPCGTELFASHIIPELPTITRLSEQRPRIPVKPQFKKPLSTFIIQDFQEWLTWLLSIPYIEDSINNWKEKCSAGSNDEVIDYNQSVAAKHLYSSTSTSSSHPPLRLAFSLFVDWFNPLGNKTSGRQVSIGVLSMQCLNLPPQARQQMKHTFLAGMVPAPDQPDMTTISHILRPLVDQLLILDQGIQIKTHHHPLGRKVLVRLGYLSGDIVANHKVAGFISHAGTFFCSWCFLPKKQLATMAVGRLRSRRDVIGAAYEWKNSETLDERKIKLAKTGVRWSELNRLPYWDPVKDVVLGIMHNWFEGVLANHFRFRWMFLVTDKMDQKAGEVDIEALESGEGWLSEDLISIIRKNLKSVKVPRGVTRIPSGLGTAANGKLKASEWHALFATHLPLAAIDVLIGNYAAFVENRSDPYLNKLLRNFCALVEATDIVAARKVKKDYPARFKEAYFEYTSTSYEIQEDCKIKQNHHYAIHSASQMERWGPMLGVSEFPGERLCGFLQKIKTNGKVEEMAQTVMRRFCHTQRLLCKAPPEDENIKIVQRNIGGLFEMDDTIYNALLLYHQAQDKSWFDYRKLPYPDGARILSAYAHEVGVLSGREGMKYSKKVASNIVKVEFEGKYSWAKILHILSLKESKENVVLVRWLEVVRDLAVDQMMERLSMVRVVQRFKEEFIPASSIVSTLAHRELPAWTLGLNEPSMLLMGVNPGDHDYVGSDDLEMHMESGNNAMELDTDVDMG